MSKLTNFLSDEKHEISSMLSSSTDHEPDSQFFALSTQKKNRSVEYLAWGEDHKPIGVLIDDQPEGIPVLNLHLDSKDSIAVQELELLLQALNKTDYFSDNRKVILVGDLNMNLGDKKARKTLADIFDQNNITPEKVAFEVPVERERSKEIAQNQQQNKGGLKKSDVKNVIFVLRRRQPIDSPALLQLFLSFKALAKPQKIGRDGWDHNPTALKLNNTLYVSISNLPTQPGGNISINDVIMTDEARNVDLALREHIRKTLENVFNITIDDLTNYPTPLNEALEAERKNSAFDLEFAKKLTAKMEIFLQQVIYSSEFSDYSKKRVSEDFSKKNLHPERLVNLYDKSGNEPATMAELFARLNPKHRVAKAIRDTMEDKPFAMKVERLLNFFLEMISPQPNNGYEPTDPDLKPIDIEKMRLAIIDDIVKQYPDVDQVQIFCNDTKKSDYDSFHIMLEDMINQYAKSLSANSNPLPAEKKDENELKVQTLPADLHSFPAQEEIEKDIKPQQNPRKTFFSAFFKCIPCCSGKTNIVEKNDMALRK